VKGKTMNTMEWKAYTIERDYAPILKGEIDLPNTKVEDPMRFLNNMAAVGHGWTPHHGLARINGRKVWTQFFLTPAGMGGRFDGGGYAVSYGSSYPDPKPSVVSFAICRHEKQDALGANHSRGWHPGSCKHCGLDMTVDSGD
jgi:hypothetical protein